MRKALIIVLAVAASIASAGGPIKVKIEDLSWMTGAWKCSIWGGTFEEYWTPAAGGTMQGCGRLVVDGKIQFMEFMSLETKGSNITMYMLLGEPSKGDKKPSPFKLTSFDGKSAVFENPKNDFPSKIVYVKEAKGMSCWIEGVQNGKKSKENFAFKKIN